MNNYKKNIRQIYKKHLAEVQNINKKYDRYFAEHTNEKYAEVFLEKKRNEKKAELQGVYNEAGVEINKSLDDYMQTLLPDEKVINSLEYQTKLNNVLNLLAITKGNINTSILDFIVLANDIETLQAIKKGYSNNVNLQVYIDENNLDTTRTVATMFADGCKLALDKNNKSYNAELARYNIENMETE